MDRRLIELCGSLTDAQLTQSVGMLRRDGVDAEITARLLTHLFQHQTHYRGQTHRLCEQRAANVERPGGACL